MLIKYKALKGIKHGGLYVPCGSREIGVIGDIGFSYIPDNSNLKGMEYETCTPEEVKELKKVSRFAKEVDAVTKRNIRERYSIEDELKLLRKGNAAEFKEYNEYVEQCVSAGRVQKAKLGL